MGVDLNSRRAGNVRVTLPRSTAGRLCLLLIAAHASALVATVLLTVTLMNTAGLWWLARTAAFSVIGIAFVSALTGFSLFVVGVARRTPSTWQWGGSLLLINALPYIALLVAGEIMGLP